MTSPARMVALTATAVALLAPGTARPARASDAGDIARALASLQAQRPSIVAIEVYHIDDRLETQVPIPPERVKTWDGVGHIRVTRPAAIDKIVGALERSRPVADEAAEPDERWAVFFVNARGRALLALYHETGPNGRIGDLGVRFRNDALLADLHRLH